MKTTFSSLACLLLASWIMVGGCWAQAPAAPAGPSPAQEILQAAVAAITRYETITAKVRARGNAFGHAMVGSGTYIQGPSRYNLVRLQMNLQLDQRQAALLQICDGKQLWIHRDFWGETKLYLLDAQRVLAAVQKDEAAAARAGVEGLALGGLPRLLRDLNRSMQMQHVADTQWENLPVRVLQGTWRPEWLARLMPQQAEAIAAGQPPDLTMLPSHAPDQVFLYLGRDDLFPYRIEYRRQPPADSGGLFSREAPQTNVLMALEFYEVHVNSAVDPLQFVYTPTTARFTDITDAYLASQGL